MAKDQKTAGASVAVKVKSSAAKAKPGVAMKTAKTVGAAKAPKVPKTRSDMVRVKTGSVMKANVRTSVGQSAKSAVKVAKAPGVVKGNGNEGKSASAKERGGKGKRKLTKKQIGMICGVAAVLVVALVVVLVLVLGRKPARDEASDDVETVLEEQEIDYGQKVTSEDGGTFKAEYQAGSEKSFAVRFADLECEDSCKNVSEVKLGKKTLKLGEDYEVKKGSIIIILTEDFMKSLKAGKHDLIIAVTDEDETRLYGVKFTVKAEPTCEEGETLEKGECVKKDEEESEEEKDDDKQSEQSNQTSAPSKSQAEIDCENQAGPTGFYAVHWTSDNEFTDTVMSGTISMHRVNGVCRPNVAQASGLTGRGFGSTGQPVSENTDQMIVDNMGQDFILWFWSDGSETMETTTNATSVWGY